MSMSMTKLREELAALQARKVYELKNVSRRVDITGNFFLTYYDDEKGETQHNVKMTAEETFRHINENGYPFDITAELQSGGATFAKLLMMWDASLSAHWYSIYTMSGTPLMQEYPVNQGVMTKAEQVVRARIEHTLEWNTQHPA